jgi:hypothetical protein
MGMKPKDEEQRSEIEHVVGPSRPLLGPFHRRTFLGFGGATVAATLLPGCLTDLGDDALDDTSRALLSTVVMTPKVWGTHPWAVVLCTTTGGNPAPAWPSVSYMQDLVTPGTGGLADYWRDISHGLLDLTGSKVFGWYKIAAAPGDLPGIGRGDLVGRAKTAAANAGVDLSGFEHVLAVVDGYGNIGNVGADVAYGFSKTVGQPCWHWCSKCQGFAFWDGSRQPGACPAGARHDHTGSSFYSAVITPATYDGQDGWRWCSKCEGMTFNTSPSAPCAGGGTHALGGSSPYRVRLSAVSAAGEQDGWRWCSKCQGLAFDGNGPGPCPAGGTHDHSGSSAYTVPFAWAADLGFLGHETGHAYGLDHAFGQQREGDFTNDVRPGAYGDYTDIMSWGNAAGIQDARFTPHGPSISAPTLRKLGWIGAGNLARVAQGSGAQSITLKPLSGGNAGGAPIGTVLVEIDRPDEGVVYTVEFRTSSIFNGGSRVVWDAGLGVNQVIVHVLRSMYLAGQDTWRWCSSCQGMIFAGTTPCPAGGAHVGDSSMDYGLLHDVTAAAGQQSNWRWCSKCAGLAFAGNSTSGVCPAGGAHALGSSSNYVLPSSGSGQSNWRWCKKCQGLGFAGNASAGNCPAGAMHDYSSSGNYVLGTGSASNRQNKWRWCQKCDGLYFAGFAACGGNAVHTLGSSDDYALTSGYTPRNGQAGWQWCSKCFALTFASNPSGPCPAGGTHSQGSSLPYALFEDPETNAGQTRWFPCTKCSAINFVSPTGTPSACAAGGTHGNDWGTEYVIPHDTLTIPGKSGFSWCSKCQSLVLWGTPSVCPAGGSHSTGSSFAYVIRQDPALRVNEQGFKRVCSKCSVLFTMASSDGSAENPCAAGGTHAPTGEYYLTVKDSGPFFRGCNKCLALAYWDGLSQTGPCPAGGRHDHTNSPYYKPPHFRGDVTEVLAGLQIGGTYMNPNGTVKIEVVTFNVTGSTVRVTST